jgi:hypothetical protein
MKKLIILVIISASFFTSCSYERKSGYGCKAQSNGVGYVPYKSR